MKIDELTFAGLDIETTGSCLADGCGICQIGVYLDKGVEFVSDIRPHEGALILPKALEVNGFTHERFRAAPSAMEVDYALAQFLEDNHVGTHRLISIGWNVAGFDLPFVRRFLPRSALYLSYRTIDLNAVCFTVNVMKWDKLKAKVMNIAARDIAYDDQSKGAPAWHDALYDARAAFYAWNALRDEIGVVEGQ